MSLRSKVVAGLAIFAALLALHGPFLRLPYFWDEAGYYVPAALDFYRHGWLIPHLTLPTGHTPLVMVYLGSIWHVFGYSPIVTRAAMILIAAATVLTTYLLGRSAANREAGLWAAALLALSPLFFAQSSLVFLDLTAALFTALTIYFLLEERFAMLALAASLAVLSKETAVVMLPVIWLFLWFRREERRPRVWAAACLPVVLLIAWAVYYHHATGFWTGNAGYLQYNLYSALTPLHIFRSLLARVGEVFVQGFNWVLTAGALAGIWWAMRQKKGEALPSGGAHMAWFGVGAIETRGKGSMRRTHRKGRDVCATRDRRILWKESISPDFLFLAVGLIIIYILMLSLVGGAILPRYMLPVFPVFFILAAALIGKLPRAIARPVCLIAAICFVGAWYINPPYPFPYEDNLSYADFIRLHQEAARYLESLPGQPVILTAWPATDELKQPFLGYVNHPLRTAAVEDFTPASFENPPRFDVLYLYSRKWNPPHNLLAAFPRFRGFVERFYDYQPAASPALLEERFRLTLLKQFERRGQWVRIYAPDDRAVP
ncbi:MAG TPA: glycosyltransferase family 39 protein [Terriglobia bacterium]|nr:glycosyltransferase family 39 protein [Terriglobia bacterium]